VLDDDPQRGPDDALVTIVEFSEFQCPFCSRVQKALGQVVEDYGNDVRIVWKDNLLSFHDRAEPAAVLARVAYAQGGDAAFLKAHDALFESAPALADSDLQAVAKRVGVSWAEVTAATASKRYVKRFQASSELARELKATGVPHFFINGRRFKGAQPYERFRDVIDEELAKAKALVAAGTARADVYQKVMEGAKQPGQAEKRSFTPPSATSPARGPDGAKVVVRVFGDYQCPYCARVLPTLDELMAKYPGQVRIVWHDFPLAFHPQARLAAEAAQEVFVQQGSEAFWKYHAMLFKSQVTPGLERGTLEAYARTVGVDMDRFRKALDEHTHAAYLEGQLAAARQAEIKGTPTTLINGYYVGGAQPLESFTRVVDAALAE
jgi:protein-disulfide isomerase